MEFWIRIMVTKPRSLLQKSMLGRYFYRLNSLLLRKKNIIRRLNQVLFYRKVGSKDIWNFWPKSLFNPFENMQNSSTIVKWHFYRLKRKQHYQKAKPRSLSRKSRLERFLEFWTIRLEMSKNFHFSSKIFARKPCFSKFPQ